MVKKSETLKQREKAQRDLIELKKLKSGEIEAGPLPSEEAVLPKTLKQKVENFFYHYKYAVIVAVFLTVIGIILAVNLITRVNYDAKVVVFSYDRGYSLYNSKIAEYFETIYPDVNENGSVDIASIDCSVTTTEYDEFTSSKLTQLNTLLAADDDALIFLLDKESIKHFTENLDVELFKEENMVPLGKDFYDFIRVEDSGLPETELFAAVREIDGTAIESKDKRAYDAARLVIGSLRERAEKTQ